MMAFVRSKLSALLLFFLFLCLCSLALSSGNGNSSGNYKRVEWVDENGVTHTSLISSPAPSTSAPSSSGNVQGAKKPTILSGKVVKVLSGDTALLADGKKLRYVGIRAPQPKERGYEQALAFHRKLVQGKFVNILFDAKPKDDDGTLLAFVFINQLTFVNAELVRLGYAKAYPQPPNIKYQLLFERLEERARTRQLGIWKK